MYWVKTESSTSLSYHEDQSGNSKVASGNAPDSVVEYKRRILLLAKRVRAPGLKVTALSQFTQHCRLYSA